MSPPILRTLARFSPDLFTVALVATVALASFLPATGGPARWLDTVVVAAVMTLFFLHGARLSRQAVLAGLLHWRLHLLVLGATFVAFPLFGLALLPLANATLDPSLTLGFLFLCCLPSTVQSSIAFTSIARGNVPAAVCAASASNLLGVVFTPVLAGVLVSRASGVSAQAITAIATQLLLPFGVGQVLRPAVGDWVQRNKAILSVVDRSAILLMVYAAFSKAVTEGIWTRLSAVELLFLGGECALLLAMIIVATTFAARRLGFSKEDEIAIVFCGSKKSLVTGVPMANVLFGGAAAGVAVLPLMLFHQIQLIVCAVLARRYARRPLQATVEPASGARPSPP